MEALRRLEERLDKALKDLEQKEDTLPHIIANDWERMRLLGKIQGVSLALRYVRLEIQKEGKK